MLLAAYTVPQLQVLMGFIPPPLAIFVARLVLGSVLASAAVIALLLTAGSMRVQVGKATSRQQQWTTIGAAVSLMRIAAAGGTLGLLALALPMVRACVCHVK